MNTFFHKIRAITRTMKKGEWKLDKEGRLRSYGDDHCPITFVLDKEFGFKIDSMLASQYSPRLMLSMDESSIIISAADNECIFDKYYNKIQRLRRIFLKTTKLKEPQYAK